MNRYFRIAREARLRSDHSTYQMGSVLVKNKQIISIGWNLMSKSHTLVRKFHLWQSIHAEVHSIIRARHKHELKGAILYVYRETKDGLPAIAKPCVICARIAQLFGIKKVIYTTNKGWAKDKL